MFQTIHIVEDKIWFDYADKYLVCDGLDVGTKMYFNNNNKKFILASINNETNGIKLLAQYTLSWKLSQTSFSLLKRLQMK